MLDPLRAWLNPPVFPEDEERTRVARILSLLLNVLLGALALGAAAAVPLFAVRKLGGFAVLAALLIVHTLARILLRRGRVRAASATLVAGVWAVFTVHMLLAGGAGSVVSVYFLCIPILAGLLLGRRAAALAGAGCILSGLTLALLKVQGLLPAPYFPLPPVISWIHLTAALVAVAIPLDLALRELGQGIETARAQLVERSLDALRLRESEQRYRLLFESNPNPMWVYDQETLAFLAVNDAAIRRYGYSRNEFLVMTITDIRPPEDVPALLANSVRMTEGFDDWGVWRHRKKDGSLFDVETSSHRIDFAGHRAILVLAQDITARLRAEASLRESERRLATVFRSSPDLVGVLTLDEGRYLDVNDGYGRILGFSRDELIGQTIHGLGIWADPRSRDTLVDALRRDGAVRDWEIRYRAKSGREIVGLVSAEIIEYAGADCVLSVTRDITERKRAEEERRKIEEQMRHVQKLESLGVLAGGIAHDFNNLLMAILGNSDLALLRLSPAAPARENLAEIVRASHRAADLCQQMLAYSGKGRFVVERLDLSAVVREMIHMLQVSISKKAVLRCDFAENLPAVEGDATQLRQVILNLITNASEALGEQSGAITVVTGRQECDRAYLADCILGADTREGPYVFLEVRDTGCGMEAATLPRIFDPFFTTKFTGRGLGLAAVLGIMRGHQGALRVASELGKGSIFTVLLPAAAGSVAPPRPDGPSAGAWRGSGTVLLVDDEEMIRATGREMLEWLGFRVLTACDGVEALALFRDNPGDIVCVVLDLTMPRMDGDEVFRTLRRIAPDVRVILSSGYTRQDVAHRFAEGGPAGFIQKPYTLDRLRDTLQGVLG